MFDRSKLHPFAAHVLDCFIDAFPQETINSIDNADDYKSGGILFVGAWAIEWLCPAGGYDWNVRLHCATATPAEYELILRWGGDHEHFGNWDREGEPEIDECRARLADIFAEKVWHFFLFRGDEKYGSGIFCRPDQVKKEVRRLRATRYTIKSWHGTFDQEVHLDDEG